MAATNSFDCGATDLLCNEETENLCLFDDGDIVDLFDPSGRSESEPLILSTCLSEDCVGWMVERERDHLPGDDYLMRLSIGALDTGLRRDALDWMIKACARHGFGELCWCLAMNYMDRFLSVYNLPGGKTWCIHLVAVACLSLAAKYDEVKVPKTGDLQAGEPKFYFEAKTIRRMEILVLNYLKWNIKPYTPFDFIEYFLVKANNDVEIQSGASIARSVQVILSTIKGIDFLEFKPSEIAAAVAVYVSGEKRAMDIDKTVSSFFLVEKGRVLKCLDLIQDLTSISATTCSSCTTTKTTNVSNALILSTSVICHSPNAVLDAAVCSSYKSDEIKVSSYISSSQTSRDKKRKKPDHESNLD